MKVMTLDARRYCALMVFVCTVLASAAGAVAMLAEESIRIEAELRRDARALAGSVAGMLAGQLGRAAANGIPYVQLPGIEAHLLATLRDLPALARIEFSTPTGQVIARAKNDRAQAAGDPVQSPVPGSGVNGHEARVSVWSAAPSSTGTLLAGWLSVAAIVLMLGLGAAWVGARVGARLIVPRERWLAGVLMPAAGTDASTVCALDTAQPDTDGLDEALRAAVVGAGRVTERRQQIEALANELLEVDFDGSQKEAIEALRTQAREAAALEVVR